MRNSVLSNGRVWVPCGRRVFTLVRAWQAPLGSLWTSRVQWRFGRTFPPWVSCVSRRPEWVWRAGARSPASAPFPGIASCFQGAFSLCFMACVCHVSLECSFPEGLEVFF